MRVHATFGQLVSGLQFLTIYDFDPRTVWNEIRLRLSIHIVSNDHFSLLFRIAECHFAAKLGDDRQTFRFSRLKKLLDTGKTLCNIVSCHTAGMECTHRKLRTRLTDRLCRDDADCLTDLNRFAGRHVRTVALRADPDMGTARKDRTDLHFCLIPGINDRLCIDDARRAFRRDHVICLDDQFTRVVVHALARVTAGNPLLQRLDHFFSIHKRRNPHARNLVPLLAAVGLPDDQFL